MTIIELIAIRPRDGNSGQAGGVLLRVPDSISIRGKTIVMETALPIHGGTALGLSKLRIADSGKVCFSQANRFSDRF